MIKRTQADHYLSLCIRESVEYQCERCGITPEDKRASHASHFIGRKWKTTRYVPENLTCLCGRCHDELGNDPHEHTRFMVNKIGEGMIQILKDKKNTVYKPPGGWKVYEKEAAKHYRNEHKRLVKLRNAGRVGRLEFTAFD